MSTVQFMASSAGVVVVAYAVGSIPWGLLIGRFNGIDIRRHGSRNIGATNVRRVLGRDWGILCFTLDFLKGLIPVLLTLRLCRDAGAAASILPILAAGATVAGHVWPATLRFQGGKGVATSIGALLALAPWSVIAALLGWLIVFELKRIVSLASLTAAVILPLSGLLEQLLRNRPPWPTWFLLLALSALIIWRHKGNMQRLRKGVEPRFERGVEEKAGTL